MTLTEIHQRLVKEFADRYVSFEVTVRTSQEDDPASIQIYDSELGGFACSNLEDGINQLKLKLGMIQPEMEIQI